jgi:hypothetical protein
MSSANIQWSSVFWGIGLICFLKGCSDKNSGTYYTGEPLSPYTDTLKEKVAYIKGGKASSDRYFIQLAYYTSKFILTDNGHDIVKSNRDKDEYLRSLSPGSLITVQYRSSEEKRLNHGLNTLKIYGLTANGITIISPKQIQEADQRSIRKWNIAWVSLLVLGCIAYFIRKRKKSEASG